MARDLGAVVEKTQRCSDRDVFLDLDDWRTGAPLLGEVLLDCYRENA